MGHYQKMEQSLSLMVFSQARCPRFAFSMYNIIIRGALLEPHAISRFRVRYLQKRDARSAILSIFTVSLGQGKLFYLFPLQKKLDRNHIFCDHLLHRMLLKSNSKIL